MSIESQQPQSMSLDQAAAAVSAQMREQEQSAEQTAEAGADQHAQEANANAGDELNAETGTGAENGDDEQSGNTESEQSGETEGTEEAGPSIETLSDLAEALGQPLDAVLANLKTTITVDGEQKQVTLKEAFDGYNLTQASQKRMQQVAEEKRQFETQRQEHITAIEQQHQILAGVVQHLRNQFIGQIDTAQLERLKVENPGEYSRIRYEIDDRMRGFDQLIQQGQQAYEAIDQKRNHEKQSQLMTYAQGEREKLFAAVPDWSEAEGKKISEYLATAYGYQPEQLGNIYDHRELVIARKAMLYDQMQQQAKTVTEKVKQLPKLVKPGQKKSSLKVESEALKQARRRFAQTKSLEDAAKVAALSIS